MRDSLVSKIRVLGSDGSGYPIRASHDSPEHVCNLEIILETVTSSNSYCLFLGPDSLKLYNLDLAFSADEHIIHRQSG
jgi:hypothetical protein